MSKTQRNSHDENDVESKTTPSFSCYHHLCVRHSSVLHWVSKSWIRVEQSEEKIERAWKQPGDKTTIQQFKHRQNHQGCSWYVHSLFFLFYAAFEHSLQFHEFWNVSYHLKKENSVKINFAYLTCLLITIRSRLSVPVYVGSPSTLLGRWATLRTLLDILLLMQWRFSIRK